MKENTERKKIEKKIDSWVKLTHECLEMGADLTLMWIISAEVAKKAKKRAKKTK